MSFTLLDWSAIICYLAITLVLGLYFRRSSGQSSEDYKPLCLHHIFSMGARGLEGESRGVNGVIGG
jgi:hypothetical protein